MIIFTDSILKTISKMCNKRGYLIQSDIEKYITEELKLFCDKYQTTPTEINYMIKHNINDFSYCKECGKKIALGKQFCCPTCRNKNKEWQEKYKKINLERYGVEHPSQLQEIKEKVKQTNNERYGSNYYSQTNDRFF